MRIDVYHHNVPDDEGGKNKPPQWAKNIMASLTRIERGLGTLAEGDSLIMANLDQAIAEGRAAAERDTEVSSSIRSLLESQTQLLQDALNNAGTPQEAVDAVQEVIAAFSANTDADAAAVVANTPAAEEPTEPNPDDQPHPDQTLPGDLPPQ